ncbi:hypothetical protein QY96_03717 [Bacillus thermotolerans]|nr:hypothetical protein QY96_03717 [Bacillus thermotolerans]
MIETFRVVVGKQTNVGSLLSFGGVVVVIKTWLDDNWS